MKSAAEKK